MPLALLEAMRPHQWVKNLLVLAPLAFAKKLDDPERVFASLQAFAVFCMLSSATYLLNDVVDRHADAAHPKKKNRPIAAGRLPVPVAIAAFCVLAAVAVYWATRIGGQRQGEHDIAFAALPVSYFLLNLGYSFWLKKIVIIDCLCIALGFGLRVHGGSVAIDVPSTDWILLCTFFFALFLAFCKRREEVERVADAAGTTRATMRDYTAPFLDQLIAPLAALSILCYALYTVDEHSIEQHGNNIKFTVPFVVFGVFRYLFLVHQRGEGADPARLLFRDRQLVISGILWALAIVYFVDWDLGT